MRRALMALALTGAVLAAASDLGRASHDRCHPAGTRSVQSAPEGRVYEKADGSRWACTYRFGRSYAIDAPLDEVRSRRPYAFAGRYLASWAWGCDGVSACGSTVSVTNMSNGRISRRSVTSRLDGCDPGTDDCRDSVRAIVLKRNASYAWIARQPGRFGGAIQILRRDRRGRRLLESSRTVDVQSLRLCRARRAVCWVSGGQRRHATLW